MIIAPHSYRNTGQAAFTLIELLVVIAIIGLLAMLVMMNLTLAKRRAWDSHRLSDISQIKTAIETYHAEFSDFPPNTDATDSCGGWDLGYYQAEANDTFLKTLSDEQIMNPIPGDPQSQGNCTNTPRWTYRYYLYPAGYYGCDAGRGSYYVLGIDRFQAVSYPHPASPGWQCPNRNWGNEFSWVTGSFN